MMKIVGLCVCLFYLSEVCGQYGYQGERYGQYGYNQNYNPQTTRAPKIFIVEDYPQYNQGNQYYQPQRYDRWGRPIQYNQYNNNNYNRPNYGSRNEGNFFPNNYDRSSNNDRDVVFIIESNGEEIGNFNNAKPESVTEPHRDDANPNQSDVVVLPPSKDETLIEIMPEEDSKNGNNFKLPPFEVTSELPGFTQNNNQQGFPTLPPKFENSFPNPVTTSTTYPEQPLGGNTDTSNGKLNQEGKQVADDIYDSVDFDERFTNVGPPNGQTLAPLTPVPGFANRNDFVFQTFQAPCTTPGGDSGSCITLAACAPYMVVLRQAKSNPDAVQTLRRAHCGFEGNNPKVCCPRPSIPTGPPPDVITTTTTTTQAPQTTTTTVAPQPVTKAAPSNEELVDFDNDDFFLEPPMCGVFNGTLSRVVGGVPAKLGDFPWMALLGYKPRRPEDSTRWLCGGSLVSAKHVLTAAHCMHNRDDLYLIRLGELDLESDDDGATPIDVPIVKKIKHEQYNPKAFTNDIGIIVLERSVQFTPLIRPICIPKNREMRAKTFERHTPFIAGWGHVQFHGTSSPKLQVVQVPVQTVASCESAYSDYKDQVTIDARVLCAGYKAGGKDACQGDSGGPLMQPNAQKGSFDKFYMYQIGVVSFGKKCALPNFPGVYTRVTYFVPWLRKTMINNL